MTGTGSPLKRSIGLSGVVWFLMALFAVLALGAAVVAGRYALAIGGAAFVVGAIALRLRAVRARKAADAHGSPPPSP